jgi:hypothetical protein
VSTYESKILAFKEQIASIAAQLVDVAARRKSFAFAAASGDIKAAQQIADCDFEADALRKQEATVASAVETALALERQEAQDAEAKARHERNIAAYKLARGIVTINQELDLALKQLREMFERRAALLIELGNTEAADRALVMRLSHKSGPTSAAHHCGLNRYLALEMTPNAAQRPLADTNAVLLGVGEAPNDKASDAPRVAPRNARH